MSKSKRSSRNKPGTQNVTREVVVKVLEAFRAGIFTIDDVGTIISGLGYSISIAFPPEIEISPGVSERLDNAAVLKIQGKGIDIARLLNADTLTPLRKEDYQENIGDEISQ